MADIEIVLHCLAVLFQILAHQAFRGTVEAVTHHRTFEKKKMIIKESHAVFCGKFVLTGKKHRKSLTLTKQTKMGIWALAHQINSL